MRHSSKLIACSKMHQTMLMLEQLLYRERMAAAIQSHCFTRDKMRSFLHGFPDNYVSSSTSDDPGSRQARMFKKSGNCFFARRNEQRAT